MSLLSVLFGRSKDGNAPMVATPPERFGQPRDAAGGVAPRSPSGLPLAPRSDGKTGVDAERADRRERLYRVVREALMRCGVLSASYKFKVLSTDARGLQFLIMLDVATETAQLMRFTEIEAIIRQAAKDQYDIDVAAVYSRVNSQLTARAAHTPPYGDPAQPQPQPGTAFGTTPSPVAAFQGNASASQHAAAFGLGQPMAAARINAVGQNKQAPSEGRFDPIHADEVNAFRQALAGKSESGPADGILRRSGARRKPMIDFEDTQVVAANRSRDLGLSATQYGDLQ